MKKIVIPVIILILYTCVGYAQSNIKKIVSYNVLEGFQQDSVNQDKFVEWVTEINPDVVAFQEMNKFTQKSLEAFARRYGHPYAVLSKTDGYPVAISSKYPIVNVQKVVDNMWHAYIYANIDNIHFFVIHLSPHVLTKRQEEIRTIVAHANMLPQDEPILIMGDFNSLDRSDSAQYNEKTLENMRDVEKRRPNIRNLNKGEIDYSVMEYLTTNGFIDTFLLTNKNFIPSVSTKKYGTPSKRIDFIWANKVAAEKVISETIVHDKYTDVMSDHYPVLLELDF